MQARAVVDLDELDLRSLWGKPIDPEVLNARIRAGKSVPPVPGMPGAAPFPFPFGMPFPMGGMFPGGPAAAAAAMKYAAPPMVGVGGKPLTPAEQEAQMAAFTKAFSGGGVQNPFLASMFMPMMGAAANAAAAGSAVPGAPAAMIPGGENWMKYMPEGGATMPVGVGGTQGLFPFLAQNFNAAAQQQAQVAQQQQGDAAQTTQGGQERKDETVKMTDA